MAAESSRKAVGTAEDSSATLGPELLEGLLRHVASGRGRITVELPGVGDVVLIGARELQELEDTAAVSTPERPSERELQVLSLVAQGMTAPQTAQSLGLSPSTVNQHLATVRRKLGTARSAQAARVAQENGWLAADLRPVVDVRDSRRR